jgi:CRP-like cAMP-binding protein
VSAKVLPKTQNLLLASLSVADRDRVADAGVVVKLGLGAIVYEQGARMRHVYFPIDSFISMLTTVDDHSTLEVGMVGSEGLCGHTVMLGNDIAPLRALTQGAGTALRLSTPALRELVAKMPAFRLLIERYTVVVLGQLARTSACTRFHIVEHRLARWLLMTSDRAGSDCFVVTQEFLAYMLGVRRVGVSDAASLLKSRRLIEYKRGTVTVLDRAGLEAAACSCYRSDITAYQRGLHARPKSAKST